MVAESLTLPALPPRGRQHLSGGRGSTPLPRHKGQTAVCGSPRMVVGRFKGMGDRHAPVLVITMAS